MAITVGRKQYNEGDMLRMQRDAEERVRAMQSRARQTLEEANSGTLSPSGNRNWSSGPNRQRNNRHNPYSQQRGQSQQNQQHKPQPAPEPIPIPEPIPEPPRPPAAETKKDGTIIGDIMGALKLDEDYLLIIGLLLILINQRADTTLILALAYLLI